MENLTQEQVVEALGNLTVVELIALTRRCEQQWGVEAKPQLVQSVGVETPVETQAAQTEFEVVFVSYPADKKMGLVKLVREVMGLGLLESKNLVEAVPKTLKEGLTKEEAETLKARLTEAGAVCEVK
jgi:large subunit ribosomal protein L7/L12